MSWTKLKKTSSHKGLEKQSSLQDTEPMAKPIESVHMFSKARLSITWTKTKHSKILFLTGLVSQGFELFLRKHKNVKTACSVTAHAWEGNTETAPSPSLKKIFPFPSLKKVFINRLKRARYKQFPGSERGQTTVTETSREKNARGI